MSYERVEFTLNTPIEGVVGSIPDGIELKGDNGVINGLWVNIGEDIENEIEASARFKEFFAKGGNFDASLYTVVKEYGIQRAQNYLNRLNFMRDSHKYDILNCSLAKLLPTGQMQYTRENHLVMVTTVGKDFGLDISETYDEDGFFNKLYCNYDMGMKAQQECDLVSAYQCFYAVLPVRRGSSYKITADDSLNLDLKIIRDGISHDILTMINMERAKTLFGDECVLQDGTSGKYYAYFAPSNPRHMDLVRNNIHSVRKAAKEYIDKYITSGVTL
jgi:hypothetical protein